MLALLNGISNGYVVAAVVASLNRAGVFKTLEDKRWHDLAEIVETHGANQGYLEIAFRMLEAIGWLDRGDLHQYRARDTLDEDAVPADAIELYRQPISDLLEVQAAQLMLGAHLSRMVAQQIGQETGVGGDQWLRSGHFVLPMLIALAQSNRVVDKKLISLVHLNGVLQTGIKSFFMQRGASRNPPLCSISFEGR